MIQVETYGQVQEFKTRKQATSFFLECMAGSQGAERDRYVCVYTQLLEGKKFCTDRELF